MQRVVSGSLGGRRLMDLPRSVSGVRPSGAKVRSAIFDRLQAEVRGAQVLDLCAGSGALAIEALSRGATRAVLVDRQPRVCAFLRAQLEALGLAERTQVVQDDAKSYLRTVDDERFDLILCDPPYDDVELLSELAASCAKVLTRDGVLVCESERAAGPGPTWPSALSLDATREYGGTLVNFLSLTETT